MNPPSVPILAWACHNRRTFGRKWLMYMLLKHRNTGLGLAAGGVHALFNMCGCSWVESFQKSAFPVLDTAVELFAQLLLK